MSLNVLQVSEVVKGTIFFSLHSKELCTNTLNNEYACTNQLTFNQHYCRLCTSCHDTYALYTTERATGCT